MDSVCDFADSIKMVQPPKSKMKPANIYCCTWVHNSIKNTFRQNILFIWKKLLISLGRNVNSVCTSTATNNQWFTLFCALFICCFCFSAEIQFSSIINKICDWTFICCYCAWTKHANEFSRKKRENHFWLLKLYSNWKPGTCIINSTLVLNR